MQGLSCGLTLRVRRCEVSEAEAALLLPGVQALPAHSERPLPGKAADSILHSWLGGFLIV